MLLFSIEKFVGRSLLNVYVYESSKINRQHFSALLYTYYDVCPLLDTFYEYPIMYIIFYHLDLSDV